MVTHGGVISVYACHLLGCSFNTLWRLRVDNASLTIVKPHLVAAGVARHWPTDGVSVSAAAPDGPAAP